MSALTELQKSAIIALVETLGYRASMRRLKRKGKVTGRKHCGIEYTEEAKTFLKTIPESEDFGICDFREYLIKKFPGVEFNKNSLRSPFKTMAENGVIAVMQKATGRKPSIYCKV